MIKKLLLFYYEWRFHIYYEELHAVCQCIKDDPTDYVAKRDKQFFELKCQKYQQKITMLKAR